MRRHTNTDTGELARMLASLPELGRDELVELWQRSYETSPPVKISQQLMISAIAYKMQEKLLGGLKPATRRFLEKAAEDASSGRQVAPSPIIKSGTRLIREWHGVTYEVNVTKDGMLFKGRHYRSLSEIARIITGVKWSGPLFFGLRSDVRNQNLKIMKEAV